MHERAGIQIVGVAVFAGIGLNEFGGAALVVAVIALLAISLSILFIWVRVRQLADQTAQLSTGVGELNDKVSSLENTIRPSDVLRE